MDSLETMLVRFLFIFGITSLVVIVYCIWKYPNAIKYLLSKALYILALIVGIGLILYWVFVDAGPTGNPYEEQDPCISVAKIC